jgi:hypothetical protein
MARTRTHHGQGKGRAGERAETPAVRAKVGRRRGARGSNTLEAGHGPSVRPASEGALRSLQKLWIGHRDVEYVRTPSLHGSALELRMSAVGVCDGCRLRAAQGKPPDPRHPYCAAHLPAAGPA